MRDNLVEPSKNESHSSFFKSLPKQQRAAFLFLSALSLGVIILWGWQFNSRLTRPFYIPEGNETASSDDLAAFETVLANADTDKDGLTDNEERSLYNTSPFLEDSDSDSQSDRQEIENGTDPNCATGQDCETQAAPLNTANNVVATSTINSDITTTESSTAGDDDLQLMMSGQANVAQLRVMLLDSGADANMLQQLSDEELLKTYQEMMAEQGTTAQ